MCGRYVSAGSLADLSVLLGVDPVSGDATGGRLRASWNVAPTDEVPAVVPSPADGARTLRLLHWGLVPSWADPGSAASRINARIETVLEKPSFRRAVRDHRVLLPADGWYEWIREPDGRRRPHLVTPADGSRWVFAGLHARRYAPDGTVLGSCSVVTGPAPTALEWLHERAPVLVPPPLWDAWLDPAVDAEALIEAVRQAPRPAAVVRAVSPAVNDVRHDGPELIEPVTGAALEPPPGASPQASVTTQPALW